MLGSFLVAFGGSLTLALDASPSGTEANWNAGWKMQSGCIAKSSGGEISSAEYRAEGWLKASVPGTVLGAQVEDGVFANPFFGMEMRNIPGTDYPITKVFGYLPMSKSSPYRCPWWYRTEFRLAALAGKRAWLHFDGINYRANIWLNGKQIATSEQVAGAFRAYDFEISESLADGKANVLAVEVFAQTEKDLGIDFLDWNPSPADKSMGLWRGVSLSTSGPVTLSNPVVATRFLTDDLADADLRVSLDVVNRANYAVQALVSVAIGPVHLEQSVDLAAKEAKVIHFEPNAFAQLHWKNPPVWWPYQYGEPHLEHLHVAVRVDHKESDEKSIRFGIREVNASLNARGYLQFQINRRNILIRGGGWTPDLFYREPKERLRQELLYTKQMNLNAIRLEGKLGSDDLFDLADEMGILVLAGWQCCDHWQQWDKWTREDHQIAHDSTFSQISRLRSHASVAAWLNGSDEIPRADVEADFLAVLKERDWPNPVLSAAADRTSEITGKSGVKMTGPYDYVPPEYWYLDKDRVGGAYGFNMETGPGPAIPSVATIHKTLPKQSWWPIDEQWKYHAGLGKFAQYDNFNNAMTATYGKASDLDDYSLKAQLMAYDGERAMFEAYRANKYGSTGVIQWMLNNAWPSFIWHLYDYDLVPGGGYFGTRKANEPLHIQYRYDDRKVVVVNSTLRDYRNLKAKATVLTLDGKVVFTEEATMRVSPDGVATFTEIPDRSSTVFVKLELRNELNSVVSDNFYWTPAQLAQLNWEKTTYVYTPALQYADMRDLAQLPEARVRASIHDGPKNGELSVNVKNVGGTIAFFLHLRAVRTGKEEEITPVFWDDNFISLLPGESRVLTMHDMGANDGEIEIKVDGWNVKSQCVKAQ